MEHGTENRVKKKAPFFGVCAAIVTPFDGGEVDLLSLGKIIDYVLDGGVAAVAVCGTTGEAPSLTVDEYKTVVEYSRERVKGRGKLIAGAGGSTTERAVKLAHIAGECGADALLCVTPYYNKASSEGLVRHYEAIAEVGVPVILYNVPSRTGVDIPFDVYRRLCENGNIVGVKEASGDMHTAMRLMYEFGDRLALYSGCDELNLPLAAIGYDGSVSVTANVEPTKCAAMWDAVKNGYLSDARRLDTELSSPTAFLFSEVNPIPVKAMLSQMGLCKNELRLPLTPMTLGSTL